MLVGEVWLASGQSNMAWAVKKTERGEQVLRQATHYPLVRIFAVKPRSLASPADGIQPNGPGWATAKGEYLARFSAVAYYFGRHLQDKLQVPVGLIDATLGGSRIETWMSEEVLAATEAGPAWDARWEEEVQRRLNQHPDRGPRWRKGVPWRVRPSGLYNGMIHGLIPYGIRGFIWYQGESNAWDKPENYTELSAHHIRGWRDRWQEPLMPFYFVQLSGFSNDKWPAFRQAQLDILDRVPATAMAVTIDIGDAGNIHPGNKYDVGGRLARAALHDVYGFTEIVRHSPLPAGITKQGNRLVVTFSEVGAGLRTVDDQAPRTFEVKIEGDGYTEARAVIIGPETVGLSEFGSGRPIAVRYGWAAMPDVNLVNGAGLPATPFEMRAVETAGRAGF